MVEVGIFGIENRDKLVFLQILSQYLEKHYIRSVHSKAHYLCLPTELYYSIRNWPIDAKSSDSSSISGTYIIENSETQNQIRFFVRNSAPKYTNHLIFSEIGDFATICSVQIILLSIHHSIENQLANLTISNFRNKKLMIYLTNTQDLDYDTRSVSINRIKREVNCYFAHRKLQLIKINELPYLPQSIHPDHSRWIVELFQLCNESVMIEEKAHNDHIFRIVALHANAVGSSSFIHRLYTRQFNPQISPTRGIDIQIITRVKGSQKIILQIFDTSGKERFSFLIENFLNYTKAIILIYDLTRPETLDVIRNWLDNIRLRSEFTIHPVPVILVGTKKDELSPNFTPPAIEWIADYPEIAANYCISNATGENVEECLNTLIDQIISHYHIFIPELSFGSSARYLLDLEKMPAFRVFSKIAMHLTPLFASNPTQWYLQFTESLYNFPIVEHELLLNTLIMSNDIILKSFGISLLSYLKHQWDSSILKYLSQLIESPPQIQSIVANSVKIYLNHNFDASTTNYSSQMNDIEIKYYNSQNLKWIRILALWIEQSLCDAKNPLNSALEEQIIIDMLQILQTRLFRGNRLQTALLYLLFHPNLEIQANAEKCLGLIFPEIYCNSTKAQIIDQIPELHKQIILSKLAELLELSNDQIKSTLIHQIGLLHLPECIEVLAKGFLYCPNQLFSSICEALHENSPDQFTKGIKYPSVLDYLTQVQQINLRVKAETTLIHPTDCYRLNALTLLNHLADPLSENAMICALLDVKESIRLLAVHSLVKIKAWTAIVPLLECYVNSTSPILEKEILNALNKLDPIRFPAGATVDEIIFHLTFDEHENFLKYLISKFEKTTDEIPQLTLIRFFAHFNDIRVLELLIHCLRNQTIRVQHAATQSLQVILERPPDKGIKKIEELNIVLQAMDNYAFFTRFDIQNFLHRYSWREILKAVVHHPIPENSQILSIIQSRWRALSLPILYELRKKSLKLIFQNFHCYNHMDELEYNSYVAYLSLSYPHSLEELTHYYQTLKNKLDSIFQQRFERLMEDLTNQFHGNLNNTQLNETNHSNILL
jgi:GTPase SAR1 family protein